MVATSERPAISVVIPVYNSALTLPELHVQLVPAVEAITPEFEILFVEDRGGDDSWQVIQRIAATDERVRAIRLSRNYGQHNALLCGIRAARYPVIVTMDDDLQNPVSEIAPLVAKLEEGYDVVYGRSTRREFGFLRNLATRITKFALRGAMGREAAENVSAFRAFRTHVRDAFADYRSPSVSIDALLTWGTSSFAAVEVKHEPRRVGKSNYSVLRLITHSFNVLTGFSTVPLQIASLLGFAMTLLGLLVLAWVLGGYLIYGSVVEGFPFLASIIAIFSGAQLFALGIFGEYVARIHCRTMSRPAYMVAESAGGPPVPPQRNEAPRTSARAG
jgi:undecaprenyl-phosphate 4-deoxy-4-formamido-L-arabinose transferase